MIKTATDIIVRKYSLRHKFLKKIPKTIRDIFPRFMFYKCENITKFCDCKLTGINFNDPGIKPGEDIIKITYNFEYTEDKKYLHNMINGE